MEGRVRTGGGKEGAGGREGGSQMRFARGEHR